MRHFISLVLVGCLTTMSAQVTPLVEDSFETGTGGYTTGVNLNGQAPSSTTGFTGSWTNTSGGFQVQSTGLSYGSLVTSGGAAFATGSNARIGRLLQTTYDSTFSGTLYFSFLMQLESVGGHYQALEFHNGGFSDGTHRQFLIASGGNITGLSNDVFAYRFTDGTSSTPFGTADTNVNMFVVKLELSASAGSDSITIYRNPTDLLVEGNNTITANASGQDIVFDRITLAFFPAGEVDPSSVTFDELRLGTSFASVTPVPEPRSAATLLGLVALGMVGLNRRRWRQQGG